MHAIDHGLRVGAAQGEPVELLLGGVGVVEGEGEIDPGQPRGVVRRIGGDRSSERGRGLFVVPECAMEAGRLAEQPTPLRRLPGRRRLVGRREHCRQAAFPHRPHFVGR